MAPYRIGRLADRLRSAVIPAALSVIRRYAAPNHHGSKRARTCTPISAEGVDSLVDQCPRRVAVLRHLRQPPESVGIHLDLARLGDPQPARYQLDIDSLIVEQKEHLHWMQKRPVGTEWDDAQRHRRQ